LGSDKDSRQTLRGWRRNGVGKFWCVGAQLDLFWLQRLHVIRTVLHTWFGRTGLNNEIGEFQIDLNFYVRRMWLKNRLMIVVWKVRPGNREYSSQTLGCTL
jgi:hypothetical protein